MKKEVKVAFGKFVEKKWRDALNMALVEPAGWWPSTAEAERWPHLPRRWVVRRQPPWRPLSGKRGKKYVSSLEPMTMKGAPEVQDVPSEQR
jgi:hypothetical protein